VEVFFAHFDPDLNFRQETTPVSGFRHSPLTQPGQPIPEGTPLWP
jgi:hypothetical protein